MPYQNNAQEAPVLTALWLLDPRPALQPDGGQNHTIRHADFPRAGSDAVANDNRQWAPLLASWCALLHCESVQGEYQIANTRLHSERALACAIDVISQVGPHSEGPLISGDAWVSASQLLSEMAWTAADGMTDRASSHQTLGSLTPLMRHSMAEALGEFAPFYRMLIAHCAGLSAAAMQSSVEVTLANRPPFEVPPQGLRGPRCYLWFVAEQLPSGFHALVAYSAVLRPEAFMHDVDAKVLRWEVSKNIYHNKPSIDPKPITVYAQGLDWLERRFKDFDACPPMLQADIDAGQFVAELRKGTAAARPSVHGWLAARAWLEQSNQQN